MWVSGGLHWQAAGTITFSIVVTRRLQTGRANCTCLCFSFLVLPDVVGVDACPRLAECMDVAAGLEEGPVVEGSCAEIALGPTSFQSVWKLSQPLLLCSMVYEPNALQFLFDLRSTQTLFPPLQWTGVERKL